ncbi:hypothetical protein ACX0G9_23955 [Flavitalea flava]
MKYDSPFRNYDGLIAAIIGFLIIHAFTRHGGIGITPDSVVYLSTAANIHDHGAIADFTKVPLMDFPAFYPIFLSCILLLTGVDCIHFGPVLNGLLFGILIYLCGWIMDRFSVRRKWYKWTLLSFIVFSPCLLEVYSYLWSETLFLILILLFLISFRRYHLSPSTGALVLMAVVAGLACITRYAGITLIGTGGLLILCDRNQVCRKKILHLFLFGFLSTSFLAINIFRNRLATGTLTGYREKGITPFGRNLHDFGSVFWDWSPFSGNYYWLNVLIGGCWILIFIFLFLAPLIRKTPVLTYEHQAITFFVVYSVFILASATLSRFQALDSRLLCPLFIPWLWGSTSWLPAATDSWRGLRRGLLLVAALMGGAIFMAGQLSDDYETWDGVKDAGIPGYTEDGWVHSETMDYVRNNTEKMHFKSTLYTNANEGIWFLTGVRSDMLPHKDFPKDVQEFLAEDHFYVVWFNDSINSDLLSIDFISHHKKLVSQEVFGDGAVYFFKTDSSAVNPLR